MKRNLDAPKEMEERVDEIDLLHLDPEERARYIQAILSKILSPDDPKRLLPYLYWDIVCFTIEFLNVYCVFVSTGEQRGELIPIIKILNSFIYSTHYSMDKTNPALGPNKAEHKEFYEEILNVL